ncbi:hypothetical protein ACP4OV_004960 [Aristida adscensionis]
MESAAPSAPCARRQHALPPSPPLVAPSVPFASCARRKRAPPPDPPLAAPSPPLSSMPVAALPTTFLHAGRRPSHRLLSLHPHRNFLFVLCVLAGRVTGGGEDVIRAQIAVGGGSRIEEIPRIWLDLDALCDIGRDFHAELDGGGEKPNHSATRWG